MRTLLASVLVLLSAGLGRAGTLVELTDGTKLSVDSYWTDGDRMHLMQGAVDMIVDKSRVKSIDDDAPEDETSRSLGSAEARDGGERREDVARRAEPAPEDEAMAEEPRPEGEKTLSEMTVDELQRLHEEKSVELLEAQDRRFQALYGGKASKEDKKAAEAAFRKENKSAASIWFQLEKAKAAQAAAAGGVPSAPAVPQSE